MTTHQYHARPGKSDEDSGGQAPDAHAIVDAGHPGSTRLGTVTPFTQESQYSHMRGLGAGPGTGAGVGDAGDTGTGVEVVTSVASI